MPTLLVPLALAGLAALPALAAIYWLRNRYRKRTVSSLMLWMAMSQAREGGTRIHKLQTPLLFLLELLALLMLVIAASGPHAQAGAARISLTVILDDSVSMLGPSDDDPLQSARLAAIETLNDELGSARYSVRLITAGPQPSILGDRTADPDEIARQLELWQCTAPSANLNAALAMAAEIAGPTGRILLLSDQPPPTDPNTGETIGMESGRIVWHALGRPSPNAAFIAAARQSDPADPASHRCLLEVANLSDQPLTRTLTLNAALTGRDETTPLRTWNLTLEPRQTRPVIFTLPASTPPITASLTTTEAASLLADPDGLTSDDTVTLLPPTQREVPIAVSISHSQTLNQVTHAIATLPNVTPSPLADALLVITDADARPPHPDAWSLRIIRAEPAESFTGPFVLDLAHPLTNGINLAGVIWGAQAENPENTLPGWPVIAVGNHTLVSETAFPDARRDLRMLYNPAISALEPTPNWPILFYNLIQWRAEYMPGPTRTNIKLGETADITVHRDVQTLTLTDPAGTTHTLNTVERRASAQLDQPGVWTLEWDQPPVELNTNNTLTDVAPTPDSTTPSETNPAQPNQATQPEPIHHTANIAVNFLDADESDLTTRTAGSFGSYTDSPVFTWEYQPIAWIFGLIALIALVTHLALISKSSGPASASPFPADSPEFSVSEREGGRL